MKGLIIHSIQFLVHASFMYWLFTYDPEISLRKFWNQFIYFTVYGNINMFWFLVPFLWTDLKNLSKKEKDQYSHNSHLAYQIMTPVMIIVGFMFWLLFIMNPKLLFVEEKQGQPRIKISDTLLIYLHGGNYMIMLFERIVHPSPIIHTSKKANYFLVYVLIYFGVYGINFAFTNEHVYGFQQLMTPIELVLMYVTLFVVLFGLDFGLSKSRYYRSHKKISEVIKNE